jgi:phage tail sheath protein FI
MLRRVLEQQLQWMVFEPNDHALRASIRHMLEGFLGQLYRARALAGVSEPEAFFVRCDEGNNPQRVVDAGQLIVEVGVAPAEPLVFIVLRFSRDGNGNLLVETGRG